MYAYSVYVYMYYISSLTSDDLPCAHRQLISILCIPLSTRRGLCEGGMLDLGKGYPEA